MIKEGGNRFISYIKDKKLIKKDNNNKTLKIEIKIEIEQNNSIDENTSSNINPTTLNKQPSKVNGELNQTSE
jgi:hypothetical protein